jgi:hypothetical protein
MRYAVSTKGRMALWTWRALWSHFAIFCLLLCLLLSGIELSHIIALITCVHPELCQVLLRLSETSCEAILDFAAHAHEQALEMPNQSGEGQRLKMGYSSHLIQAHGQDWSQSLIPSAAS